MLQQSVLVLNQNYLPINVCNARRAIKLVFKEKAEVVQACPEFASAANVQLALPSIIRLHCLVRQPRIRVSINRRNILRRDNYTCQYCGSQPPSGELTIDHVVPRSKGGQFQWTNLVTACKPCNHRKANRTPQQASMPLQQKPKDPSNHLALSFKWRIPSDRADWQPYLSIFG